MPLLLHKINITQFRSYETLRLDVTDARMIVLTGANGAGKTNILEAISLLTPGRGLRGADLGDICSRSADAGELWAVAAEIETADGMMLRLGAGEDKDGKKSSPRKIIRINGRDAKNQNELAGFISAVWLTPQMDRIFLDGAAARRKFLDRLVFSFDPAHAGRLSRYEKRLRERLRLLVGGGDLRWISTLEKEIAGDGVAIAVARAEFLRHLEKYVTLLAARQTLFPTPSFRLSGGVDAAVAEMPSLAAEENFLHQLSRAREDDAAAGKTSQGPHRTDFLVRYAAKDMPADQCSTGEQKGLLVSIILAHALMMRAEKGFVPLILLDEVAAHLDDARREQLFMQLQSLDAQVWLTGTDADIFGSLQGKARFFHVTDGHAVERQAEKRLQAVQAG